MFQVFSGKPPFFLGLTIEELQISLVEASLTAKKYRLEQYFEINLPETAFHAQEMTNESLVIDTMRDALKNHVFKTNSIMVALSDDLIMKRVVQMNHLLSDDDILQILTQRMDALFSLSAETVYFDFKRLELNEKNPQLMDVLVVASQKKYLSPYFSVMQNLGLEAQRVHILSQVQSSQIPQSQTLPYPVKKNAAIAFALAMSEGDQMINLLPWRFQKTKRCKRNFFMMCGMAMLVAVVFVALMAVYLRQLQSCQTQRNHFLLRNIAAQQNQVVKAKALEKERTTLIEKVMQLQSFKLKQIRLMRFFYDIASVLPHDAYLTEIKSNQNIFSIQGCATSSRSISLILRQMEQHKWLGSFTLSELQNEQSGIGDRDRHFKLNFSDGTFTEERHEMPLV